MSLVLGSIQWGKPAFSLLNNIRSIDSKPAIMHVRHSEKLLPDGVDLTEKGVRAAYDFGKLLPPKRTYRVYHTERKRTRHTAKHIHQALHDRGTESTIIGNIGYPEGYNVDILLKHLSLEREQGSREPVKSVFYNWIGGRYSPESLIPVIDFGRWMWEVSILNLRSADDRTVDLYVSHENWVAAFMFTWLGVNPENWVNYLDGFLTQLDSNGVKYYTREESRTTYYPWWWKKPKIFP
jgi:broad specificity phosphatase PhoE